jgi:hypothetical protein
MHFLYVAQYNFYDIESSSERGRFVCPFSWTVFSTFLIYWFFLLLLRFLSYIYVFSPFRARMLESFTILNLCNVPLADSLQCVFSCCGHTWVDFLTCLTTNTSVTKFKAHFGLFIGFPDGISCFRVRNNKDTSR